jgi:hypothetical protein
MDRNVQELRQGLTEICKNYGRFRGTSSVVVDIPFIPYIPDNWNGVLVLAEAQNLYEDAYKDCSDLQKIYRLYPDMDCSKSYDANKGLFPILDIKPWEDGSIPLALKAALEINPFETAICNSCLWSLRKNGINVNPNDEMRDMSRDLWKEMWSVLGESAERVVCCGSVAASIFDFEEVEGKRACLRLPSPNALSRVSGMFNEAELFKRYPEVEKVFAGFSDTTYRQNKIFFACHAVSILKQDK